MKSCPSASTRAATSKPSQPAHATVTHDCICKRAYELFLARSGGPGDAESDWCQAERELRGACDYAPPGSTDPLVIETRVKSVAPTSARR